MADVDLSGYYRQLAVVCPPLPKAARAPENIDRAAASETVRAIHADVLRFGMDRVFPPEERGGAD